MKISSRGQYYGSMRSVWKVNGVGLSEYDYLTPQTDWHYHENPYFMYVLQGELLDVNQREQTACPTGSLVFHNWQESHFNRKQSERSRGFHIEFDAAWFEDKKLDVDLWEGSQRIDDPRLHRLLGKLYFEFKCRDVYSEAAVEMLLLQICEGMQQVRKPSSQKEPPWVAQLKELLREEQAGLSLKELSETLGVHPVHLSRSIPKYLSGNLGEYTRLQKLKQSLGLLLDPAVKLTTIAHSCGFSDQSHFTRTFKLYFGRTPKSFRSELLK